MDYCKQDGRLLHACGQHQQSSGHHVGFVALSCTDCVSSVSLPSTESNATAVSLPSVSRSVMSSPYTVLTAGKPSDHAFVQLQPQPAHQVRRFVL